MTNHRINTGFSKCFILFMAVVILLQGVIYLGLSVWGITLRQCPKEITDISSKPFQFAMELIYFLNKDCGNPSVKVSDDFEPITLNVDFSKAEPIEYRTFIFFITYAVTSTFWVVTSLAIIITLCGPITKTVNNLCFWPWFLVILAGSVLDAVATGYHLYDIINTTSVVKTFNYLSITANKKTIEILSNFNAYFITPAAIMTCISSRFILIWLLNIIGSSFCLSLSYTLSQRDSSKKNSITSLTATDIVANLQVQSLQEMPPLPTQQQELSKVVMPPLRIQRESSTNLGIIENMYTTATSPHELVANIEVSAAYQNTEAHPERLSYPPQRYVSQYQTELSHISPLNKRYLTNNDSFQFPTHNQTASEELRGQLPWSYTCMPPAAPKKPEMQVYPKIPEPDYGH